MVLLHPLSTIHHLRVYYPFTFAPHLGQVPSARAVCTPGHIGQSSWAAAVMPLLLVLLIGWVVGFFFSQGM